MLNNQTENIFLGYKFNWDILGGFRTLWTATLEVQFRKPPIFWGSEFPWKTEAAAEPRLVYSSHFIEWKNESSSGAVTHVRKKAQAGVDISLQK